MKKLFTGYRLGDITLKIRFVMAPMTRSLARDEHATALTALYYAQCASAVAFQGGSAFAWDEDGEPATVTASPPRALLTEEIKQIVADFSKTAANAISAGFDGVEVQGANGYLIEQFINPVLNTRDDGYGGKGLANRARLLLEIVDAISDEIGISRTGVRLSPCNQLQGRYR